MYIFHGKVKDTCIFTGESPRSWNPQKELQLVLRVFQPTVESPHHLSPLFLPLCAPSLYLESPISDANKISYSSQTHYMLNTVLSILHILLHLISTTNLWSNINRIFIKILFLIGRRLLYNVVLVSVGQQHASALSIHTHTHTYISSPSWASSSAPISPL